MKLLDLGNRICILGPSNSGKSTLATAISRKCHLKVIHLDQLFHLPNTNWQERPADEFISLHDMAIKEENWVIDGNYTRCLTQRLSRATGVILLDISTPSSLLRYANRTLFQRNRCGALEGNKDSIKWKMIHHITVVTPTSRKRYAALFERLTIPKIKLTSIKQIKVQFNKWDLTR
ncbi:AAA family ATPase [Xenorhabdus sp. DI]|uniref:AAA family ATPase n=1 Tax=Xenorhabdus doucetiae TaxID=351671 RepID=UPI00198B7C6B|nr:MULTISPECIES: AAA family ATPase [unclassified Xenorhabdus]MBD2784142.1 AAA family ATPase [Xenorhabdus sp. 3]MBD2789485.1 AAA family ATPase [Xenorhabdus sp. DI]